MKTLRALMLMLALSVCTYAGEMPNKTGDAAGEMPNVAGEMPNATDPITELAISLLQSLVSLI